MNSVLQTSNARTVFKDWSNERGQLSSKELSFLKSPIIRLISESFTNDKTNLIASR